MSDLQVSVVLYLYSTAKLQKEKCNPVANGKKHSVFATWLHKRGISTQARVVSIEA
jgi:hypothetical protein